MPIRNRIVSVDLDERARRAMIENGFEPDFEPAVLEQVKQIETDGQPKIADGVADLRDLLWSSIDNRTSRDLDQVEYAERLPNGEIKLLVGIADVDSLVDKNTPIDEHAATNTVTVYTESEIFPMLPEELSTDRTSLNEHVDRLAIVVELVIDANGDVPGNRVFRAMVRNNAKLSYEDVGDWIDENAGEPAKFAEVAGLIEQVEIQLEAAHRLHKFRMEKGALEFESIESSPVVVDGQIRDIESIRPNSARKIIENFMIAANVEMAEFLELNGSPSIRRIVKTPERWSRIRDLAADYGTHLPDTPDNRSLSDFLAERRAADPDHFPDLSLAIVKLMGSGEYVVKQPGVEVSGHFGLGIRDYAHSTAPNRRYPDLVVQRLVKAKLEELPVPYTVAELEQVAADCNDREKAARKVERKMRKIVAASVMQSRVGESFDAIVTGATDKGTFARILRPPVDGRIVRGERETQVGDKVRVRLIGANPKNGFIDFSVEHGR
ncbi:MAG: RNB domain-containing ribonuclease [Acidobacteriota bacterium]